MLIQERVKFYTINLITTKNSPIVINVKEGTNIEESYLEKIVATANNTRYITVTIYYRVNAFESQIQRFSSGFLSVFTYLKLLARMIDNIRDGCGGIGENCIFLEEGILFFNNITNFLIKHKYHPVGSLTMANEMMKQSYYKPNSLVKLPPAGVSALGQSGGGKRRKSFKKKKGSKKKNNIKK